MPSFIELMSAKLMKAGTWEETQWTDFPKGCGFEEVKIAAANDQDNEGLLPMQHVVKGALSENGLPFMVVLSFPADTQEQTINELTEQVLKQIASLDNFLIQEIFKITEHDCLLVRRPYSDTLKAIFKLRYEAIEEHLNKKCQGARFSVMLHAASPKHPDMHHSSYRICIGRGNVAVHKPDPLLAGELAKHPEIACSTKSSNDPTVFFEDGFFNAHLKFVVANKAFGMKPAVTHYQEDFIDLLYQQQQQKLQSFIQSRYKQLGDNDQCVKAAQDLLDAIQVIHANGVDNIATVRELVGYLAKTITLLEHPDDNNVRKDFLAMAEQVQGKPQYGMLIGGIMLALFGAVVAGLSIAASVATGGLALPLTSIGIKTSLPLIGTSVSMLATAGFGTLLVGAGAILAWSGRRSDLSKQMMTCYQTLPKQTKKTDTVIPATASATNAIA